MKTFVIACIFLLGGCNALVAADKTPSKVKTAYNHAKVSMMENRAGLIRLACEQTGMILKVKNPDGTTLVEKVFNGDIMELDVRKWNKGSYEYNIIRNDRIMKAGLINVLN